MGSASEKDLGFCWQQVLSHDPWFRLHYLFAPEKHAEAILAVHALSALLEETLDSSEESLTITRLQWWRSELQPESAQVSAHPVLRALRESRNGQLLPTVLSDSLMAQLLLRLQAEPLQDQDALRDLCIRIGRGRIAIQSGLSDSEDGARAAAWRCAGTGLASLMEFAIRSKQNAWWFIPLELQARFQFDMNDLQSTGSETQGVFQALSAWLDEWFEEQIADIAQSQGSADGMRRHLVALSSASQLRMSRTVQSLLKGDTGNPGRWKMTDLLRVWSSSRRA